MITQTNHVADVIRCVTNYPKSNLLRSIADWLDENPKANLIGIENIEHVASTISADIIISYDER